MKNNEPPTHGIVHTGFRGIQAFVTRKKSGCNLIVNRFVIPHDTIPSNVVRHRKTHSKLEKYKNDK